MKSRVARPLFVPIGAASGMMQAAPAFTRSRAAYRSGYIYGMTTKPSLREDLGRADGLLIVREQVLAVAHDLDLHKIAAAALARQTGNADGLVRGACARGVRQQGHALSGM